MAQPERVDMLVLGSGEAGTYPASHLAPAGQRTAVVERRWVGGSCPNINCLPSKNENREPKGGMKVAPLQRYPE
jgi:pyruvate/2-oxoglutarate dehydrogenase complex dihydrolipoamide dehydrogenase (E3) component